MHFSKINSIFCLMLSCVSMTTFANVPKTMFYNKTGFYVGPVYLQPASNNLKYAVLVSGNQPYQQSWHYQEITPSYSPGFEAGFFYGLPQSDYNASIDWLYLNSNDSSSKQASENTDIATVEFVAPPYDVGPAVFGIKRADSKVNFNFNNIQLNIGKMFETIPNVQVRVFGGLNILRIYQSLDTTFSDYAGSPPIATQAYGLPRDPNFYFETKNVSTYLGVGPDLGVNIQYETNRGIGVIGQFSGTLTAGSISAKDNFTSASTRLRLIGIDPSSQSITNPNTTQLVPGLDSKLGLFYNHSWPNCFDLAIEAGYRFSYYENAISEVVPSMLVQAGENATIPEFATGTMAIQSTDYKHSPFSVQGPYINLTLALL